VKLLSFKVVSVKKSCDEQYTDPIVRHPRAARFISKILPYVMPSLDGVGGRKTSAEGHLRKVRLSIEHPPVESE
jgi:hypothetical protein